MPRIVVRPLVNLTKEQWRTVLRRVMEHEEQSGQRALSKQSGEMLLNRFEPPVERKVGALYRDLGIGGEANYPSGETLRKVERLPIEEARAKYFANPGMYRNPTAYAPPMKQIRQVPPGSPEELAQGLAYEKIRQVPIVTPRTARTQGVVGRELKSQAEEQALTRAGVGPEDIRAGVKPSTVLAEKGLAQPEVSTEIGEQLQAALVADQLWKDMGGGRSMGAKVWEMYRSSSRQKSHIKTNRDYFVSSFVRWKQDPVKFERAYPREAKLLMQLWQQFEASVGGVQ